MPNDRLGDTVRLATMMTVCVAGKTTVDGDYFKIETESPVATFDSLKKAGLINEGDFSGVAFDKEQKYRKETQWRETRAAHWSSGGRDAFDHWEDAHMEPAQGYYAEVSVPDGFNRITHITTSKRADIRQEDGALFLALETIDTEALQKRYEHKLAVSPVSDILRTLLGEKAEQSLTDAFNAVCVIKPLSVEETLDDRKVQALHLRFSAAVSGVKDAIEAVGISDILPDAEVKALAKRACGLDL